MNKILRYILHKKIYLPNASNKNTAKTALSVLIWPLADLQPYDSGQAGAPILPAQIARKNRPIKFCSRPQTDYLTPFRIPCFEFRVYTTYASRFTRYTSPVANAKPLSSRACRGIYHFTVIPAQTGIHRITIILSEAKTLVLNFEF